MNKVVYDEVTGKKVEVNVFGKRKLSRIELDEWMNCD